MYQLVTGDERRGAFGEAAWPPDDVLVRDALADRAAFVHLYDRYVPAIYRYCWLRLRSVAAEDATSVTFLNALRNLDSFNPDRGGFRAWLFRIAHNATVDVLRERRHAPLESIGDAGIDAGLDDHVVAIDRRTRLEQAVATLSADQQTVIHLRLIGLKGIEIADVTGKSPAAIRSIQHRAIERLRVLMGDEE